MASGLCVCRINRPHTWPHRPKGRTSKKPCQRRAVHTWRDEMSGVRQVTSFVVVQDPVAGKLRLEPEDLLQLISGKIPPELQSAY